MLGLATNGRAQDSALPDMGSSAGELLSPDALVLALKQRVLTGATFELRPATAVRCMV